MELGGDSRFESLWRAHRPALVDLAFGMLGNIGDAEDMVQEAFTRLLRADVDEIDDVRGWLIVVVSRLCLDVLRSARHRRVTLPGEVDLGGATDDPADRVTLDDSVRLALFVVLEKLTPAERAVFVLHDVFRYPFDAIAAIVGRTPAACRKLASRARERVESESGPARFSVEPEEHRRISEQFIAACAGDDIEALMRLLDAEVSGSVDLGDGLRPPVQAGRERVSAGILRFIGGAAGVTLVSQPLNGWPGVLAFRGGRLETIVVMKTRDGRIHDIHAFRAPQTINLISELVEGRRLAQ
jgi:RNA polymerase sigma-70 factor (ECF subfamily)